VVLVDWDEVNALVPIALQGGQRGTAIHSSSGPVRVIFRPPRQVVREICRYLEVDVKGLRRKLKNLGGSPDALPLPVHPGFILAPLPFPLDSPAARGRGYVSFTRVIAYQRFDRRLTTIWFEDRSFLNCALTPAGVELIFRVAATAREMIFREDGPWSPVVREPAPVWLSRGAAG
jgi:hypothetical protein